MEPYLPGDGVEERIARGNEYFREHADEIAARAEQRKRSKKVEELPNLLSARRLFWHLHDGHYISYMQDMWLRHPIMYILFYRWWLLYSLPVHIRWFLVLPSAMTGRYSNFMPQWATFALYHPILFVFWLLFYSGFQLVVKCLTAPIQIFRALKPKNTVEGTGE